MAIATIEVAKARGLREFFEVTQMEASSRFCKPQFEDGIANDAARATYKLFDEAVKEHNQQEAEALTEEEAARAALSDTEEAEAPAALSGKIALNEAEELWNALKKYKIFASFYRGTKV